MNQVKWSPWVRWNTICQAHMISGVDKHLEHDGRPLNNLLKRREKEGLVQHKKEGGKSYWRVKLPNHHQAKGRA